MSKRTASIAEAAHELGITPKALRLRIGRGQFPHRKWGKKIIVLRSELDQFLNTLPGKTLAEVEAGQ